MRSAGINGITQIPRAALKVESATMQNHTVPKKIAYNCSCDHTNELDQEASMAVVNYQSAIMAANDKADDAYPPVGLASFAGRR